MVRIRHRISGFSVAEWLDYSTSQVRLAWASFGPGCCCCCCCERWIEGFGETTQWVKTAMADVAVAVVDGCEELLAGLFVWWRYRWLWVDEEEEDGLAFPSGASIVVG